MHGQIFVALRHFAGPRWDRIAEKAGFSGKPYLPIAAYPAAELSKLVAALADEWGQPVSEVLDSFGSHLAPALVTFPGVRIPKNWRALDVIEHSEAIIHNMVRRTDRLANPPALVVERTGPEELTVRYGSPLRLCSLAKGIVRGLGKHYGERLHIREVACMLLGNSACVIMVRRVGSTDEFMAVSDAPTLPPPPDTDEK